MYVLGCKVTVFSLRFAFRLKSLHYAFAFFFAFLFLICAESALSSTGTTSRFDVLDPPRAMASLVSTGGARPAHGTTGTTSLVPGIVLLHIEIAIEKSSFDSHLVA